MLRFILLFILILPALLCSRAWPVQTHIFHIRWTWKFRDALHALLPTKLEKCFPVFLNLVHEILMILQASDSSSSALVDRHVDSQQRMLRGRVLQFHLVRPWQICRGLRHRWAFLHDHISQQGGIWAELLFDHVWWQEAQDWPAEIMHLTTWRRKTNLKMDMRMHLTMHWQLHSWLVS